MGEIIEFRNVRSSRRKASHTTTSDGQLNSANNASLRDTPVQPGMAILFNLLERRQAIRLPDGTVYRLLDDQLEVRSGEDWQPAKIDVNELLSQVSMLSRSQWREVINSSK